MHLALWQAVLAPLGVDLTEAQYRQHHAGVPTPANAIDLVQRFALDMTPQALVDAKNRATLAYLADRAFPLMPGALEVLSRWHRSGRPLAIVTGAGPEGVAATLKHHGLAAWVSTVVTGEDVPRSKPAPDVYLLALQRLGLPASQCLAVEDTQHGVMAATAAGLRCLAVPNALSAHHRFDQAHAVLGSWADVESYFDS